MPPLWDQYSHTVKARKRLAGPGNKADLHSNKVASTLYSIFAHIFGDPGDPTACVLSLRVYQTLANITLLHNNEQAFHLFSNHNI